jgi:tRNA-dihydrouridine synthase B
LENPRPSKCVLIGRGALGRPWIFQEINDYLKTGKTTALIAPETKAHIVLAHIKDLHHFYGDFMGVRIARKHFCWYCEHLSNGKKASKHFNSLTSSNEQLKFVTHFFNTLSIYEEKAE